MWRLSKERRVLFFLCPAALRVLERAALPVVVSVIPSREFSKERR
jgi:hypothetical protein